MLPDLEELIGSVNDLIKDKNYSLEEKNFFKRIRQRAYDRRRNFKPATLIYENTKNEKEVDLMFQTINEPKADVMKVAPMPSPQILGVMMTENNQIADHFLQGVKNAVLKIDGEKFIKALPGFLILLISTLTVGYMVWLQSLDLYKSTGFSQPGLAAAGAIIMIVGFAAYHAVSRTWLGLILCLYAGGYEAFFMISGTAQNENTSFKISIENDPEVIFLKEKAGKSRENYMALKARYDDPSSTVSSNEWFKKKHLEPAWNLHEKDQGLFLDKKMKLEEQGDLGHVTWLKVLYRLGLVFLCMVLVHTFIKNSSSLKES